MPLTSATLCAPSMSTVSCPPASTESSGSMHVHCLHTMISSVAQHSTQHCCIVLYSIAWHGIAQHSIAWHGSLCNNILVSSWHVDQHGRHLAGHSMQQTILHQSPHFSLCLQGARHTQTSSSCQQNQCQAVQRLQTVLVLLACQSDTQQSMLSQRT